MSALPKVKTEWKGKGQDPWRTPLLGFYIQDHYHKPDIVVDITPLPKTKKNFSDVLVHSFTRKEVWRR